MLLKDKIDCVQNWQTKQQSYPPQPFGLRVMGQPFGLVTGCPEETRPVKGAPKVFSNILKIFLTSNKFNLTVLLLIKKKKRL
jgi:hypothetical protein